MAFSMQTTAFASIVPDQDDEIVVEECLAQAVLETGDSARETALMGTGAVTETALTSAAPLATAASVSENPTLWSTRETPEYIWPCFRYAALEGKHIVDGKEVIVSVNNDPSGTCRNSYYDLMDYGSGVVSSNVFKLNEDHYLIVIYTVKDDGLDGTVSDGALNYATTSSNLEYEPVVTFSGRIYSPSNTKKSGTKNNYIKYEASLIKFDAKTRKTEIICNTLSANSKAKYDFKVKAKVKNTKYATVSRNANAKGDYDKIQTIYNKSGELEPYFTIQVQASGKFKDYGNLIKAYKKTISSHKFKFQIRRGVFGGANPELVSDANLRKEYAQGGKHGDDFKDREVTSGNEAYTYHGFGVLNVSTTTKKIKDPTNPKSLKIRYVTTRIKNKDKYYNLVVKKSTSAPLIKGDCYLESLKLDNGDYAVVVRPAGNFEENGACPIYRNVNYEKVKGSGKYVTELRGGFYMSDNAFYINALDE